MDKQPATRRAACEQVFVLSLPRSGSTLLRILLDTHPAICCPGELELGQVCKYLHRAIYYTLGQIENGSEEERTARVDAEVKRIISQFMGLYRALRGKTIWAEKAPSNVVHADLLRRIFPNGVYVCLYRQPLDFIRSYREAHARKYELWDFGRTSIFYVQQTRALLDVEKRYPDITCRIYYENLVAQPTATLRELFEFLGVEWDASIVEDVFRIKHDDGPGDPKAAFSTQIYSDSVGKGNEILPELMKLPQRIRDEVNELAAQLGYPAIESPASYAKPRSDGKSQVAGRNVCSSADEFFSSYLPAKLKCIKLEHRNLKGSVKLVVKGEGGGTWTVNLNTEPAVIAPVDAAADCTIILTMSDLLKIVAAEMNIGDSFLQDRIRVTGNESLAMFLGRALLSEQPRKRVA